MSLHDSLPFWNPEGQIYKELVGDPSRPELDPITNVNDLNRGAIENALEWHARFQQRALAELDLREARGVFLRYWSEIYGIERPSGMTDPEFARYIINRILSVSASRPAVYAAIPPELFRRYNPAQVGAYADLACADVGPLPPENPWRMASAVCIDYVSALWVLIDDPAVLTPGLREALAAALAAGSAIYGAVR